MAGTRSPFREETVVGLLRPDPGASGSHTEPSLTWRKKSSVSGRECRPLCGTQ